jgi:hypothetical protein
VPDMRGVECGQLSFRLAPGEQAGVVLWVTVRPVAMAITFSLLFFLLSSLCPFRFPPISPPSSHRKYTHKYMHAHTRIQTNTYIGATSWTLPSVGCRVAAGPGAASAPGVLRSRTGPRAVSRQSGWHSAAACTTNALCRHYVCRLSGELELQQGRLRAEDSSRGRPLPRARGFQGWPTSAPAASLLVLRALGGAAEQPDQPAGRGGCATRAHAAHQRRRHGCSGYTNCAVCPILTAHTARPAE